MDGLKKLFDEKRYTKDRTLFLAPNNRWVAFGSDVFKKWMEGTHKNSEGRKHVVDRKNKKIVPLYRPVGVVKRDVKFKSSRTDAGNEFLEIIKIHGEKTVGFSISVDDVPTHMIEPGFLGIEIYTALFDFVNNKKTYALFVNYKIRTENNLGQSFYQNISGLRDLKFSGIHQFEDKLTEMVKSDAVMLQNWVFSGNVDYAGYLVGISLLLVLDEGGGCSHFAKQNREVGKMLLVAPRTGKTEQSCVKGNNCGFIAIRDQLSDTHPYKKIRPQTLRKMSGFVDQKLITMGDMEKLSRFFGVSIEIYDQDGNVLLLYSGYEKVVRLTQLAEHWYIVQEVCRENQKCERCGKPYFKYHTCDPQRISYYTSVILKQRCVLYDKRKIHKYFCSGVEKSVFFDLETFPQNNVHTPYACGYCVGMGDVKISSGENCVRDFLTEILGMRDTFKTFNLIAYNGSGYDFHIVIGELMKMGYYIRNIINSGGSIITFEAYEKMSSSDLALLKEINLEIKSTSDRKELSKLKKQKKQLMDNYHVLRGWDLYRHLMMPLRQACNDLGCEVQKGDFDHFKIKSFDDVNEHKEEWSPYLFSDVLGLRECFLKWSDAIWNAFEGTWVSDHLTTAGMAYSIWKNTEFASCCHIPTPSEYEFCRKACYGGRTHPMQQFYESVDYGKEYSEVNDWLAYLDVVSLYPTVMEKFAYPVGKCKKIDCDFNLNVLGVYKVSNIVPNRSTYICPLPSRQNGRLKWDFNVTEGYYTNIDLQTCVKYGWTFDIEEALVWEDSEYVFQEYIRRAYSLKENAEKEGKKGLRACAKLLLNALYGKMLEKPRVDVHEFLNSPSEIIKFSEKAKISSWNTVDNGSILMHGSLREYEQWGAIKKPVHLGVFILAYTRRYMLDIFERIGVDKCVGYYTDTDSIITSSHNIEKLQDMIGSDLGKLSDDTKQYWGKVIKGIFLAPKTYCLWILGPDGKLNIVNKAKGIPKEYLDSSMYSSKLGVSKNIDIENLNEQSVEKLKKNGKLPKDFSGKVIDEDFCVSLTSFKKTMRKAKKFGHMNFGIENVQNTRTFCKTNWNAMELKNNIFYPIGHEY